MHKIIWDGFMDETRVAVSFLFYLLSYVIKIICDEICKILVCTDLPISIHYYRVLFCLPHSVYLFSPRVKASVPKSVAIFCPNMKMKRTWIFDEISH